MTDEDIIEFKLSLKNLSEDVRTIRHSNREIKQAIVGNTEFGLLGIKGEIAELVKRVNQLDTNFETFKEQNKDWQHKVEIRAASIAGAVSVLVFLINLFLK